MEMHKYHIVSEDKLNSQAWEDYALNHPNGTMFHTPFAYKLFNQDDALKSFVFGVVDGNGQIRGLAQGYIQTVKKGFLSNLTKRSVLMQSILYDSHECLDKLLLSINRYLSKWSIYTEIRNSSQESELLDTYGKYGYFFEDHLDILVDLVPSNDDIFNQMSKTRRKQINRGYGRGVHIDTVDRRDLEAIRSCYEIIANLYKQISLPCPNWEVFKYAIIANPTKNEPFSVCFAAKLDGLIIGTRVVLCFKKRIFDWYAGSIDEHYDKYPNDVLPWEVFKWGHENGFEVFDFGGAGKPNIPYGVRDYKLKFGGSLVNYGRYQCVHSPVRMAIATRGFKLLQVLKKRLGK